MTEGRLSDYVSGRLSAAERARLERAVEECALCREELESLQQTRALLQALPGEPLPRSFVFSEAPAPAESEGHRTAQAPAFRMPGWAYAGAAAVAGVAALVFVLSGAAGVWLAQDGGDEFGGVASTASMEMAQAESIPAPAAVPESVERARPAAQAAPAMEQSMAAAPSSSASLPAPMEDSAGRREGGADVVAEGEVAKEVEQEVVVERILESGIEPTPGAEAYAGAAESAAGPDMAAEPQLAAMAEAPAPTAAPAAAEGQEGGAIEAIAGSPAGAEAMSPGATAGRADSSAPAPTVKAETDAARSTPMDGVQAAAAEVAETPTSTPVVQSAVIGAASPGGDGYAGGSIGGNTRAGGSTGQASTKDYAAGSHPGTGDEGTDASIRCNGTASRYPRAGLAYADCGSNRPGRGYAGTNHRTAGAGIGTGHDGGPGAGGGIGLGRPGGSGICG